MHQVSWFSRILFKFFLSIKQTYSTACCCIYIHDLKTHHTHKLCTAGKKIYENFIQHFSLIIFFSLFYIHFICISKQLMSHSCEDEIFCFLINENYLFIFISLYLHGYWSFSWHLQNDFEYFFCRDLVIFVQKWGWIFGMLFNWVFT